MTPAPRRYECPAALRAIPNLVILCCGGEVPYPGINVNTRCESCGMLYVLAVSDTEGI